ncbi:sigma-70 family RNA polymerase sigma factor [Sphingosinicella soli]|uniref:RNA polymerase sigma-70 factor (ECF subfamily) n=1 Tax=Sphingosinicella soli TaxID=333708 RepID=A0A7W7F7T3_9SPHN|nr:sigma-70 family RNA polymerase sigma factor [Sphingosinicella soli]MBB4632947.1 RNA polymerase sigma-70 factor (ECF subfamily) [Sphingosinicella soli]
MLQTGLFSARVWHLIRHVTDSAPLRNLWIARHVLPNEPALRRYLARQKLPGGLDAEDVVQEVYGRIVGLESVDHIRDPRAFMVGTARNILLMHYRRSRIVPICSAEDLAVLDFVADDPTPEQSAVDRQQLHLLAMAVARTREPWRSAFLMRVTEELPHGEIARRLGLSENAVQKGLARTLTKLMLFLGRGGNDPVRATKDGEFRKDNDGPERVERGD